MSMCVVLNRNRSCTDPFVKKVPQSGSVLRTFFSDADKTQHPNSRCTLTSHSVEVGRDCFLCGQAHLGTCHLGKCLYGYYIIMRTVIQGRQWAFCAPGNLYQGRENGAIRNCQQPRRNLQYEVPGGDGSELMGWIQYSCLPPF